MTNAEKFNSAGRLLRRLLKDGVTGRAACSADPSSKTWSAGLSTVFSTALACAVVLAPSAARASLLAYEGFNYSGGSSLTGKSGGFGWNGAWQQQVNGDSTVPSGGSLSAGSAPTGYNSLSVGNSAFTPNQTREGRFLDTSAGGAFGVNGYIDGNGNIGAAGKTIYISFMQQASVLNNYYEFELHRGNLNDPGRMSGIGNDTGDNNVHLRYETPAGGSSTFYTVGPGNTGVNFYVVRIDYTASGDTVTVYQNPTSTTEAGATPQLVQSGLADMSFNGISFVAFNGGSTVAHDEVRIGTTWADVTSPGATSTGLWNGGGANNNWSTGANWDNGVVPLFASSLTFAGNAGLNNTNDLTGVSANKITFDSAAGAFTLNGNSLGLNGNLGFNANPASPITQIINLALAASQDITIDTPTNGNLTLDGNVTSGNNIFKIDAGTLTLSGTNAIQNIDFNGGTNIISGSTTINGTGAGYSRFYVADGDSVNNCTSTLIIQPGAELAVTGSFYDAAVIGRDSGTGTVIQNGGTFTYAAGSHLFLVGASGTSIATRAEYHMNGGVFDMSTYKLGVGLGVNGYAITGAVYQVGGVITNVGNLDLGTLTSDGYGEYDLTGGSIYIGSGGITTYNNNYGINLGGGTVGAEANWTSSLNMTLTGNNGPVTFNPAGSNITLSGVLSGSGGLTVDGSGVLELSGANKYTGDTTVNTGSTLQLDVTGSSTGAFRLVEGGLLYLNFSGNYAVGSLYTNGVALPVGIYNAGNLPGFITGSGNLQVASGISTGLWTGGGADNNWSTAGNWDNNAVPVFPHALTFAGNTQLNNNNDLSGITISSLTFDSIAGAFTLGGNDVALSGGIGFNANPAAPVTQTINLNMTWNADKTIDTPTNGNLTLGGNISASANTLTKIDAGTLTLGGVNSFAGYIINNGTNVITGNTTVNGAGSSVFYLGNANTGYNGTLVIQPGAILNVAGNFGDALVIGRDGGSGRIIQNGGTFTYAGNQSYLLVGATSHSGTQAEYDMNGGILDMNGNTLGVALGDFGVVYTAVLNQSGGAINNVFKLDLGALRANGIGVYNLSGGIINIDLGGITSDSGSYQVNLGGGTVSAIFDWSSSLNMNLTNVNGSVTFDPNGSTITLSGTLSGNGGLIVTNPGAGGTLVIAGANTYRNDTVVSAGATLQYNVSGVSDSPLRVVDTAMLNLNYSGTRRVPAFYTNGVALPYGTYNSGNLPGFITGSGDLLVSSGVSTGIWDGGGTDNYWSTAGNWDNDIEPIFPISLTFSNNVRLVNTNDLTGITANNITFDSMAGAFVLNGNSLGLGAFANIAFNGNPPAPTTQTINLPLATAGDITVGTRTNGSIIINGDITGGNQLTQSGPDNAGVLTLTGNNALKGIVINNGTNIITGNTTINGIGGSSFFYVPDAGSDRSSTLIIESGATLTVSGGFQDAAVIARDGAHGRIIQNGGTFNFAINDGSHNFLFVGGSGQPNAQAEYDMNGGVLDMNGDTLGIALGVNGPVGADITGVVNQSGGIITNVLNLYFSPFFANGNGTYNLTGGSLYIGAGGITVFSGGAYQMNLGGGTVGAITNWSSALDMTLTGINGPVTFDTETNTITLSGALTGSGGLTKVGTGTLDLSGTKSYSGDTTVNGGILQLDTASNNSGTFKLADGAMLNLNYSGTIPVNNLYTNNVSLPVGTYNSANLSGFIAGIGSIQVTGAIPSTPTTINFSVSAGQITIKWPPGYKGWVLQTQTNSLGDGLKTAATNWVDVAGSASETNATMTINPNAPTVFYRLRYPTP